MDALSPVKEVSGKTFPIFLGVREIRESSLTGWAPKDLWKKQAFEPIWLQNPQPDRFR